MAPAIVHRHLSPADYDQLIEAENKFTFDLISAKVGVPTLLARIDKCERCESQWARARRRAGFPDR